MLSSKTALKHAVADYLRLPPDRLQYIPLSVNNSMSGQIEDGIDGSIFCLSDTVSETDYILKLKSNSFIANVGQTMNYYHSRDFAEAYRNGYGIFYIRDSYRREKFIYEGLSDELRQYLPRYYGSLTQGTACVHLMERLQITQSPVRIADAAKFVAQLHARYLNQEAKASSLKANFPTLTDYENAVTLSHILLENVAKFSILPEDVLQDIHAFVDRPSENYNQLIDAPRTLCHGDFCVKNLTFLPQGPCVYDWELATFNHPEFDLISFLVHYPTRIDESVIREFLTQYRNHFHLYYGKEITDKRMKENLMFNIRLYMATRFHAMINISKRVTMPYMPVSVCNWLFLYRYFIGPPSIDSPKSTC